MRDHHHLREFKWVNEAPLGSTALVYRTVWYQNAALVSLKKS